MCFAQNTTRSFILETPQIPVSAAREEQVWVLSLKKKRRWSYCLLRTLPAETQLNAAVMKLHIMFQTT